MPMQTTAVVLYDGYRNLIMQLTGVSDGSGDETLATKVDVTTLSPPCKNVKILDYQYEVSGGLLQMYWDADNPVMFEALAGMGERDFDDIRGMTNGGGPTATGNILFSTQGFDSGSSYSVTLTMKKKY